ncbi:MAG: hypothetical protein MI739_04970 [Bacteroidales bacterium]|nr:hypothetical protein [Bacteroidales bacterium]
MKILAIEKELKSIDWKNEINTLVDEAKLVYKLMLSDFLREIYFTESKNAILILECESKEIAKQKLQELPLVQKQIIDFELMELNPYTGLSRLINEK